jgi:DNA-binding beta-propeller fold protein YncE
MKKLLVVILGLALIAACGTKTDETSNGNPNPGGTSSGGLTPNTGGSETPTPPPEVVTKKFAVVGATNYTDPIASVASISLDGAFTVTPAVAVTDGNDVALKSYDGLVYVINRFITSTVQVLDAKNNFAIIADYSVGAGSNPQDLIVTGGKAYISRLDAQNDAEDASDVLVINPSTGAKLGGFDLKGYMTDDGEKLPRAAKMLLVGKYLYVLCQDLTSGWMMATTSGKVIVIDTETDAVVKAIELNGRNPADLVYSEDTGKIYISDTGTYDTSDSFGGIEVIDVTTNTTEGIKIDDAAFGGAISELELFGKNLAYTISSSLTLASFDPENLAIVKANIYTSPAFWGVSDIELDGETVLLTEPNATSPGIVAINPDGAVLTGPLSVGAAPPVSIAIVEYDVEVAK